MDDGQADVLIVGAGPTGLTLAAQLDAMVAMPRLIDRSLERVNESRALAIQPRTLELLRPLGISQALVERGNDSVGLQLHVGERVFPITLLTTLSRTAPTRSCCSSRRPRPKRSSANIWCWSRSVSGSQWKRAVSRASGHTTGEMLSPA
jgi:FAD binding domain